MNPIDLLISQLLADARRGDEAESEAAREDRLRALVASTFGNPLMAHLLAAHVADTHADAAAGALTRLDPVAALRAELAVSEASLASAQRRIKALELQLATCRKRRLAR